MSLRSFEFLFNEDNPSRNLILNGDFLCMRPIRYQDIEDSTGDRPVKIEGFNNEGEMVLRITNFDIGQKFRLRKAYSKLTLTVVDPLYDDEVMNLQLIAGFGDYTDDVVISNNREDPDIFNVQSKQNQFTSIRPASVGTYTPSLNPSYNRYALTGYSDLVAYPFSIAALTDPSNSVLYPSSGELGVNYAFCLLNKIGGSNNDNSALIRINRVSIDMRFPTSDVLETYDIDFSPKAHGIISKFTRNDPDVPDSTVGGITVPDGTYSNYFKRGVNPANGNRLAGNNKAKIYVPPGFNAGIHELAIVGTNFNDYQPYLTALELQGGMIALPSNGYPFTFDSGDNSTLIPICDTDPIEIPMVGRMISDTLNPASQRYNAATLHGGQFVDLKDHPLYLWPGEGITITAPSQSGDSLGGLYSRQSVVTVQGYITGGNAYI